MNRPDIETIHPLAPLQQGMLFHALADGGDRYVNQLVGTLEDPDVEAFRDSLRLLAERNPALRSTFVWKGRDEPLQVVLRGREAPIRELDWQQVPADEQPERLRKLLADDREGGFDLARGPLMRSTLVRTGAARFRWVWTYHHLLLDGWSTALLLQELDSLYRAVRAGREPPPATRRPYADYLRWLASQDDSAAKAYWREALAGARPCAAFGTPPPQTSGNGGTPPPAEEIELMLDPAATAALAALGRRRRITMNTLVQGAWALLLGRYTRSDDVVFGAVVAGRPPELEGVERMVGMFINTLPVRVRIPAHRPAAAWLHELQDRQAEARQFEHAPLTQVRRWAGAPGGAPLFDTLLVFENYPSGSGGPGGEAGLRLREQRAVERTGYPLTLAAAVGRDRLRLTALVEPAVVPVAVAERVLKHLRALLAAIAEDPDRPVGELPLLTRGEEAAILARSHGDPAPVPECVQHAFERQARATPAATAVAFRGETLSYDALNRRANQLAHHLVRLGVGPEVRVAVLTERRPELLVALLGVLKAGGAYLPLDPAYPPERLALMMENAGAALLLAGEPRPAGGPAVPTLRLDRIAAEVAGEPETDPAPRALPENAAYVIYTSGSSGRPKGVVVRHASLANYARAARQVFGLTPADRVLQFASLSFDTSAEEIYPTLLSGAALELRTEEMLESVPSFLDACAAQGITVLDLPTSYWHEVAAALRAGTAALPAPLRLVVIGGERALPELVAAWREAVHGRVRLVNTYGPTEITVAATAAELGDAAGGPGPVSIGRPIRGVRTYVVDPSGRPVPPGIPGELWVGGAGVARGYLARPGRTAESFAPDPFGTEPGGRVYRTGDAVRWNDAGELEFLGRMDDQLKLRGYRIEPGEIEALLRAHEGVRDAVAVVRADAPTGERLVAYVVPPKGADAPEPAALRAALAERLPPYMVPAAFVPLQSLPLTPRGKVDRAALPAPAGADPEEEAGSAAPRTPVEEILCGIWAEVLGRERVAADGDFFALGGDSLLAIRAVSRIRRALGVELPVRAVFDSPTPARLAPRVERERTAGGGADDPPPRPRPAGAEVPLSLAQERLWLLDQMEPDQPTYNLFGGLRLRGPMDAGALERALEALWHRHEALRTTFVERDAGPVQVVAPPSRWTLPTGDLSALPAEARETALRERGAAEALRPFDLSRGPLFRALLLRLADDDHALLLVLHHVVSDGWSMGVLLRELSALYAAFSRGKPDPLPALPLQYGDFALWQRARMRGARLERELAYWRERMAGAPDVLDLPTDRPRPPVPTRRGGTEPVCLPPELADRLRALGRREGCTLFMVILAAFQLLLSRYARREDVVVGTSVAGRGREELEPMVGMFFNALPLRTDLSGAPTFRELLARVRDTTLGAYDHQELPFDRLVAELRPERAPGRSPLFQVLFELHAGGRGAAPALAGLETVGVEPGPAPAKLDLALVLTDSGSAVSGRLHYAAELWELESIRRMHGHLRTLLEAAVADPDERAARLPLLTPEERRREEAWNATGRDHPPLCIHELFEEQARRTPDAVAVEAGGFTLTYAELDRRADRLAGFLRARGVGPEVRVAFCLERTPGLVVALFGILKAGGAYVPLDASLPPQRLRYMLEDSGAALLLVHEPLRERVPAAGAEVIVLAPAGEEPPPHREAPAAVAVGPANLAYVYYTSGSTGRPKGVLVPHLGVTNYFRWGREAYRAGEGIGAPVFSSMAVDLTLTNFIPLFAGARVVLVPEGPGIEALARDLRRRPGYSLLKITPTHLALLNFEMAPDEAAAATRVLVVGADNLLAEPTLPWQDGAPGVALLNEYGPTETVVGCSAYTLAPGRHREGRVPIGRPIDNLAMHVLEREDEPAPVGIPGELYIGGVGVARGYLGRPALTAEKFVPDPFSPAPGARLYRTGDLARRLPSGDLEFLGRMDFQVKVRGYRIEAGEVEAALAAHPAVREVVVTAREDAPGEKRLVAYLSAEGEAPSTAELRDALRERLPEYMVPAAFVWMDALPVAASGKVDRRALPAPADALPAAGFEPPADEVELQLVRLWEETLGVRPVGVEDRFFDIGGDSLTAVRLTQRTRRRFGCEVPVSVLVAGGTVRDVAAALRDARGARSAAPGPIVPLQPEGTRPPLFCVHPAGGNVHCYLNLARHLDLDRPVFGIQDPRWPLGERTELPIPELAALYREAIAAAHPRGPVHLLGWSFGGTVAFEIARQLRAQRQEVGLLALLDTSAPDFWMLERSADVDRRVLAAIAREKGEARGRPVDVSREDLEGLSPEEQHRLVLDRLSRAGVVPDDTDPELIARALDRWWQRVDVQQSFRALPYPGRLTLLTTEEGDPELDRDFPEFQHLRAADPTLGWGRSAAVEVHRVPGTHATAAAEPHAPELAARLAELLERAEPEGTPAQSYSATKMKKVGVSA